MPTVNKCRSGSGRGREQQVHTYNCGMAMAESVREHLSGVSFAILTYHGDIIGEKGVIISSCCTESLRSLEKILLFALSVMLPLLQEKSSVAAVSACMPAKE